MKIYLVYLALNTDQFQSYNYGLGYISAVLKQSGYQPVYTLIKYNDDVTEFLSQLKEEKPDIIAFSITSAQYEHFKIIINEIKKIEENSRSFIVCGGVHPTLDPESVIEINGVDCLIRGEGEYAFLELVKAIDNKKNYVDIKNCWFRTEDNVIKNEIRPLIENLDDLPFPDKESLNFQQEIIKDNSIIRFIFSRGCPFNCTYCCNSALSSIYPNSKKYFRQRSPVKAIEEIEDAVKNYKFNSIIFDDDIITLNKAWFFEFFELYKEKFRYPFRCNIRVGTVDDAMMKLLKDAGASNVAFGIEQGNEDFRKRILKRNMTNKQIIDTINLCKKYNIRNDNSFVMVGLPFENKKLFFETVRLYRKASTVGTASIFQPYPGTLLGDICKKNNWMPDKQFYNERIEATISYPDFSKEQIQLCSNAFRYLVLKKSIPISTPLEIVPAVYDFLESKKVIFDYYKARFPDFPKKQIQLCYHTFRFLRLKKTNPTNIPSELAAVVGNFIQSKKVISDYYKNRLGFIFSRTGIAALKNRLLKLLRKNKNKKIQL